MSEGNVKIKDMKERNVEELIEIEENKELTRAERLAKKISDQEKEKLASWKPKTQLGRKVKSGEIKDIDYILDNNLKILEEQIVDSLISVKSDLILMGQSKGKFGGGKRRAGRQTQRKTKRACSSFDCSCDEKHTVPFKVTGKSGSVEITLIPAPQGTGLVAANEVKKILKLAGIKDIYSKTFGKRRTTFNLTKACIGALKKTNLKIK